MQKTVINTSIGDLASAPSAPVKAPSLLNERSPEGQQYRESLLRGKKVVFVSCGGDITKEPIYDQALSLGMKIILVESEENELAKKLAEKEGVQHVVVDLTMSESIVQDCVKCIDDSLHGERPDGVVTFWDDAVGLTARIAAHYGVKSNSVLSIDTSHDKYQTRKNLEASGIPVPQFMRINSMEEMVLAASKMSYPAILKPVQGAASIGVSLVKSENEAVETYKTSVLLMEEVMREGDLMGLVFDAESTCTTTFVFEEFVDGEEVDVDMCLYQGNVVYSNINGDWPIEDERFIELGISFPAKCNQTSRGAEFREAAKAICDSIGIRDGVVHVEMKYSSKYGPILIELNPRMGGGPLYQFHKRCFNIDLVTEHLLTMCGFPSNAPANSTHVAICTCLFIYAPKDGICGADLNESDYAQDMRQRTHVTTAKFTGKKGDVLHGWLNRASFPTAVGRLDIAVETDKMDYDAVIDYCKMLRKDAQNFPYAQ